MHTELIDIVVPVWNHPVEARNCLARLIEHSPYARLILVDNGSDRETERMLEEFAEALDVKVLFLKNRVNEGFVRAVNRGLARSDAGLVGVVRQNSVVQAGWLEPLRSFAADSPDAGIIAPFIHDRRSQRDSCRNVSLVRGMEIPSADFAAVVLRRELLECIGGFNEEMDGGIWCLKEYSRRAWRAGYRTCIVPEGVVEKGDEKAFGSTARRNEQEQSLRTLFRERWGEEKCFCIHLPKGTDLQGFWDKFDLLLAAARQGKRIILLPHAAVARDLERNGVGQRHANITVNPLSMLMPERSARNWIASVPAQGPKVTAVYWQEGTPFPTGMESLPFAEMERVVREDEFNYMKRRLLDQSEFHGGCHAE